MLIYLIGGGYVLINQPFTELLKIALINNFWFLKSLFACYLIAYIGARLTKKKWIFIVATLALSMISKTHQIPLMYLCFMCGMFIKDNFDTWRKHSSRIFAVSAICFWLTFLYSGYHNLGKMFNLIELIMGQSWSLSDIVYLLETYVMALSGSILWVSLFIWIEKSFLNTGNEADKLRVFSMTGQYTLGIYLVQTILLELLLSSILPTLDMFNTTMFNLIITPLMAVVIITCCVLLTKIIERNKVARMFLLGKTC